MQRLFQLGSDLFAIAAILPKHTVDFRAIAADIFDQKFADAITALEKLEPTLEAEEAPLVKQLIADLKAS